MHAGELIPNISGKAPSPRAFSPGHILNLLLRACEKSTKLPVQPIACRSTFTMAGTGIMEKVCWNSGIVFCEIWIPELIGAGEQR